MVVHLLRHGEVHNPDGILYGRLPGFGLSARGRAMARRVAETFAGMPAGAARPGSVTASPLQRAQETAAPLGAALGMPVGTDDRLIEAANDFQGQRLGGAALLRPDRLRKLWNPLRPSWGEPYDEVATRMWAAIHDAAGTAAATGHPAVLVSHQLPIWVARRGFEHRPPWGDPRERQCALASVTTVVLDVTDEGGGGGPVARSVDYWEPVAGLDAEADGQAGA